MLRTLLHRLRRPTDWGDWTHLDHPREAPRYALIERWRRSYAPEARVLDLGCGAGEVAKRLTTPTSYVGVDINHAAIEAARTSGVRGEVPGAYRFDERSINVLPPEGERFGLVLFNEVLYYQPSVQLAIDTLQAYEPLLEAPGLFLVSVNINTAHPERPNEAFWQAAHAAYAERCIAHDVVRCDAVSRWHLGLYAID